MASRIAFWTIAVVLLAQVVRAEDPLPEGARVRLLLPENAENRCLWCITFSPDGRTVAVGGSDKRVHLFDVASGKHIRSIGSHRDSVWTVAFSPNGKLCASGGRADFPVRMWDPATGTELKACEGPHHGGITHIVFFRDGKRLIMSGGSWDPTIRIWDVEQRKQTFALSGHSDYINAMDLASHGRLAVSGSQDGTLRLWDLHVRRELRGRYSNERGYAAVAFAPDGHSVASGGLDCRFQIWETISLEPRLAPYSDSAPIYGVAYSPDGQLVACVGESNHSVIKIAATGGTHQILSGHQAVVRGVAFSPDGRELATCDADGKAFIWKVKPLPQPARMPLSADERRKCWQVLGSNDAKAAFEAILQLAQDTGPVVEFLGERLKAAAPVDERRFASLIANLDNQNFREREGAMRELERAGEAAHAAMAQAVTNVSSAEARARLRRLLSGIEHLAPESLQELRAVEVLDRRGGPAIVPILERLARGSPTARLTVEAQGRLNG